jgi:hypothetical protein
MSELICLKKYTNPENIEHVMYDRQEIEQIYHCKICGDLQVISGVVWHIKPMDEHDEKK